MRASHFILTLSAALLVATGCSTYRFRSSVPEELRTIAVPVFENNSGYPEIDAVVTQYVLREFQREGTFKISSLDNASLKLLGKLVKTDLRAVSFDRNYVGRTASYRYSLTAEITVVERGSGKLIIDALPVKADTIFLTHGDMLTGMQDAGPRIAKELSRAIVDAVLAHW